MISATLLVGGAMSNRFVHTIAPNPWVCGNGVLVRPFGAPMKIHWYVSIQAHAGTQAR